jgi:hypothetical protein
MTWPATCACPASTSALWQMCWGAPPHSVFICPVVNVLGCTPLILCFISSNSHLMTGVFLSAKTQFLAVCQARILASCHVGVAKCENSRLEDLKKSRSRGTTTPRGLPKPLFLAWHTRPQNFINIKKKLSTAQMCLDAPCF